MLAGFFVFYFGVVLVVLAAIFILIKPLSQGVPLFHWFFFPLLIIDIWNHWDDVKEHVRGVVYVLFFGVTMMLIGHYVLGFEE